MLMGVMLFAIGTGIYAAASLGRGSYEAVTFSFAEKNGWQVKVVRMVLDYCRRYIRWKIWSMYDRDDHHIRTGYSIYRIKNKANIQIVMEYKFVWC